MTQKHATSVNDSYCIKSPEFRYSKLKKLEEHVPENPNSIHVFNRFKEEIQVSRIFTSELFI